ncbi:hypothetical protein LEM8419_03238 [Neolewinella maritima]|uniref:Transposase IS200-like domain-containing protein n=1 Tax=Neolewinella maritima TaxID=1383882 RepID=A0ABN8F5V7_9BACT|nr:transposase [Neolewinella maritima]CAH1002331.1 hypothetical protein LEM8419_03238 [Neolewinella maritima]
MDRLGNVSHFPVGITPVHINYRLYGSIPQAELKRIQLLRRSATADMKRQFGKLSDQHFAEASKQEMARIDRMVEAKMEHTLHQSGSGPMYLRQPELRDTVLASWQFLHQRKELVLYAACLMSNHVHAIVSNINRQESLAIGQLMSRHKTFTAGQANKLLQRSGQPFWERQYFDRTVRDGKFLTAMWYVLNNPVKAHLVERWQDWPGTFVNPLYLSHFTE